MKRVINPRSPRIPQRSQGAAPASPDSGSRSWHMRSPHAARIGMLCSIAVTAAVGARVDAQNDTLRRRMLMATVRVVNMHKVKGEDKIATGSGVLLGHGNYVATNWHVVDIDEDGQFDGPVLVGALVGGHVKVVEATAVWHASPASRDIVILRMDAPFL